MTHSKIINAFHRKTESVPLKHKPVLKLRTPNEFGGNFLYLRWFLLFLVAASQSPPPSKNREQSAKIIGFAEFILGPSAYGALQKPRRLLHRHLCVHYILRFHLNPKYINGH